MAKFNEILSGRFNRALQKLLSMKGGPPAGQLARKMGVQFPLPLGVEFRYLEQWERSGVVPLAAGVAAANSAVRLRNPAGSNIIAVVEKITASTPGLVSPVTVSIGSALADLVTPFTPNPLDPRGRPNSTLFCSGGTSIGAGTAIEFANLAINANYDFILTKNKEINRLPGQTIQLRLATRDDWVDVTFHFWKVFLEDSERT